MFDCGSTEKALADKRRVDQDYKVGDKVLLSTKYLNLKHSESSRKLLPKWIGLFEVVHVVGPVAYKLKMNPGWRVLPVFHVSLLEPYREDGRVQPPPPLIEMEGALEYEVESIRFLSIDFGALRTLKPIIRLPGRVMESSITLGARVERRECA
jgi:hypothetical protein